jgi:regulator of protease activity HflC (stomatin/prohibitin superfamily)
MNSKNQHKDRILILQRFAVPVFGSTTRDGEAEKIDFLDGTTAAVRCDLWMQIGDPNWNLENNHKELTDVIKTYIYGVEDAKERARSLVDDIVRPLLQSKTVDQILGEKSVTIDGQVKIDLSGALQEMGLWLAGTNPVTIGDVAIEQTYREAREKKLIAMKEREAKEEEARGIRRAAEIIATGDDGSATGDKAVSVAEGLKIQQRLAAIAAARGSKLTLVHPSIGVATAALLDGDSGEAPPQPRANNPQRR